MPSEAQKHSMHRLQGLHAAMGALAGGYGSATLERHRSQVTRADLLRLHDYLSEIEKWRHDAQSVLAAGRAHREAPLPGQIKLTTVA